MAFNEEQKRDIDKIVSVLTFVKAENITITDLTTLDEVAVSVFGLVDDSPKPKKRDGFYGTWNFKKSEFDWVISMEGAATA